jgi:DNA topoisomerase-1
MIVYEKEKKDNQNNEDNQENEENQENENNQDDISLPTKKGKIKLEILNGTEEFTRAPTRYTEASLVKKLDPKNLNIGRPATYASIISKIKERRYVEVKDIIGIERESIAMTWTDKAKEIETKRKKIKIGNEKGKFQPTELGEATTIFLIKNFEALMDYKFTAKMETELDEIANGKQDWQVILSNFYKEFNGKVSEIKKTLTRQEQKSGKLLGKHPNTKQEIYAVDAKYGPAIRMYDGTKDKYVNIREPGTIKSIKLEDAIKLLEFPKVIGKYKDEEIIIYNGKKGYYIRYDDKFINVDESMILEDIIKKIENQKKSILEFKKGSMELKVYNGQYGYYVNVKDGTVNKNISLPKELDEEKIKMLTKKELMEKINKNN